MKVILGLFCLLSLSLSAAPLPQYFDDYPLELIYQVDSVKETQVMPSSKILTMANQKYIRQWLLAKTDSEKVALALTKIQQLRQYGQVDIVRILVDDNYIYKARVNRRITRLIHDKASVSQANLLIKTIEQQNLG